MLEAPRQITATIHKEPRATMPALLELFSGTGSVGRAFEARGWEVVSVDCVAKFRPTHCVDILA